MGERTVFDDVVLRGFELQFKWAIPKVFCARDPRRNKCWSGFVVSVNPVVILTVFHPVKRQSVRALQAESAFYVQFYGDCNYYPASAVRWSRLHDLLVLTCLPPVRVSSLQLINPDFPILTSTSLFSISHTGSRHWRTNRGSICCPPFLPRGDDRNNRALDVTLFDHDVQLFPGASGAPLIDLMGRVQGMQISEISVKEHALCVHDQSRQPVNDYEAVHLVPQQIKELSFLTCDLKQAIPMRDLAKCIRVLFQGLGVDPNTELAEYLRRSVNLWSVGHVQNPPAPSPSSAQGPSTLSRKKPRTQAICQRPMSEEGIHDSVQKQQTDLKNQGSVASTEENFGVLFLLCENARVKNVVKRQLLLSPVLSVTHRAEAGWQPLQPQGSTGYFDNDGKLAQQLCACKQAVPSVSMRAVSDPVLVKFLRPRQREGVQFIFECVSGLCSAANSCFLADADDIGSGNLLQSVNQLYTLLLQVIDGNPKVRKAVIVTPINVLSNWDAEIMKWVGKRVRLVTLSESTGDDVLSSLNSFASPSSHLQPIAMKTPNICGREPYATEDEKKLGIGRYAELSAKDNQTPNICGREPSATEDEKLSIEQSAELSVKDYQVNVVRANASMDIHGDVGFLNLGAPVGEMEGEHQEKDPKITGMAETFGDGFLRGTVFKRENVA